MNTPPAITIGIMTRNYGRYLGQAIDSVLCQGRADLELIISDDASTDDTSDVVARYLNDPRIRYVRHEKNLGQAGNWKFLLAQGTAPVVTVLHADDYWLPNTLETVVAAFEEDLNLDMLYGNWRRMIGDHLESKPYKAEGTHRRTGHEEFRYQIVHHSWLPSATFLTRRVIAATGWPNPDLRMVVDTEYFLRVSLRAQCILSLAEPLTVYRTHSASTTLEGNASGMWTVEKERMPKIIALELEHYPHLQDCEKIFLNECARSIFSEGIGHVAYGRLEEGHTLMRRAIRLDPNLLRNGKARLDCILVRLGRPCLPLFRMLHARRLAMPNGS